MVELTFRPIDFTFFGLADSAVHPYRWLHYVNGGAGEVWQVVLGHGAAAVPAPGTAWATVTSTNSTVASNDDGWTALDTAITLTSMTTPNLPVRRTSRYEKAQARFATDAANNRAAWTEATWSIDNQPHQAFTMTFAAAWAGFTTSASIGITVVSTTPLNDLCLRSINNSDSHAFDLNAPIEFPESYLRSQTATWGEPLTHDHSWPLHTDHDQLRDA